MSEEHNEDLNPEEHPQDHLNDNLEQPELEPTQDDVLTKVTGMYKDWFLDYASYVILERAVPAIEDGFKPVQRRIMHSMKDLDDGRYNKVANIVGHTMQYHPHGDASIGDAMVQVGQKDLLIDMQGNWGNILTGDRAAASRYIEARLSKFALEVLFNPKITDWQLSYDGRRKEPINLPVRFPLLLAQGAEGIAVGLSTRILPHNFIELIDASIKHLQGKRFKIYPDFQTGGEADISNYNDGLRGGKVRVRAKISQQDKNTLLISEIPYGTTTTTLIDSILKANDKGKIKIKKIEDNTAANVEILVHLPPNISPDKTIDALYAFTRCEESISPLSCIIINNRPEFIGVSEILRRSTDHTVSLLKSDLEIKLDELESQWHYASLERIFIENRIYKYLAINRGIVEVVNGNELLFKFNKDLKNKLKSRMILDTKREYMFNSRTDQFDVFIKDVIADHLEYEKNVQKDTESVNYTNYHNVNMRNMLPYTKGALMRLQAKTHEFYGNENREGGFKFGKDFGIYIKIQIKEVYDSTASATVYESGDPNIILKIGDIILF